MAEQKEIPSENPTSMPTDAPSTPPTVFFPLKCSAFEEVGCLSECEPTCVNPDPGLCVSDCSRPVCTCKQGLVRASDGNCILRSQCVDDLCLTASCPACCETVFADDIKDEIKEDFGNRPTRAVCLDVNPLTLTCMEPRTCNTRSNDCPNGSECIPNGFDISDCTGIIRVLMDDGTPTKSVGVALVDGVCAVNNNISGNSTATDFNNCTSNAGCGSNETCVDIPNDGCNPLCVSSSSTFGGNCPGICRRIIRENEIYCPDGSYFDQQSQSCQVRPTCGPRKDFSPCGPGICTPQCILFEDYFVDPTCTPQECFPGCYCKEGFVSIGDYCIKEKTCNLLKLFINIKKNGRFSAKTETGNNMSEINTNNNNKSLNDKELIGLTAGVSLWIFIGVLILIFAVMKYVFKYKWTRDNDTKKGYNKVKTKDIESNADYASGIM